MTYLSDEIFQLVCDHIVNCAGTVNRHCIDNLVHISNGSIIKLVVDDNDDVMIKCDNRRSEILAVYFGRATTEDERFYSILESHTLECEDMWLTETQKSSFKELVSQLDKIDSL